MSSRIRFAIVFPLIPSLVAVGCARTKRADIGKEDKAASSHLISMVKMSDGTASAQLLSGFYAIEGSAWRWTAGSFSVVLPVPAGAAQRGGTLAFNFTIPGIIIQQLKNVTLSASLNGAPLKTAEYEAPGGETFTADVPASMLGADSVKVDFSVARVFSPEGDKRTLGVIANWVSLNPR